MFSTEWIRRQFLSTQFLKKDNRPSDAVVLERIGQRRCTTSAAESKKPHKTKTKIPANRNRACGSGRTRAAVVIPTIVANVPVTKKSPRSNDTEETPRPAGISGLR